LPDSLDRIFSYLIYSSMIIIFMRVLVANATGAAGQCGLVCGGAMAVGVGGGVGGGGGGGGRSLTTYQVTFIQILQNLYFVYHV